MRPRQTNQLPCLARSQRYRTSPQKDQLASQLPLGKDLYHVELSDSRPIGRVSQDLMGPAVIVDAIGENAMQRTWEIEGKQSLQCYHVLSS